MIFIHQQTLTNKSRLVWWTVEVVHMGTKRNAYEILVGKSEAKRLFWRLRRRCDSNIKLYLNKQAEWKGADYINLVNLNTTINFLISWNVGNFLTKWRTVCFSKIKLPHGVHYLVLSSVSVGVPFWHILLTLLNILSTHLCCKAYPENDHNYKENVDFLHLKDMEVRMKRLETCRMGIKNFVWQSCATHYI